MEKDQYASSLTRAKVTDDLIFIVLCSYNPAIEIYKYNGTQYIWHQNLTEMSDSIIDIYITNNSQYMACGGSEKKVRIYQNDGETFSLSF